MPDVRESGWLLYSRLSFTLTSPRDGNGMPTQNTARALSSLKSSPSLTLPRYTARNRPPLPLSIDALNSSIVPCSVCAPGSSTTTVLCASSWRSIPLRPHSSMTRDIREYLGRKTNIPPGTMGAYRSSRVPSWCGILSLSCTARVKSPSAAEASTCSWPLGIMCGASTLMGNATPSSPSSESVGLSVPEVRMTQSASLATGRKATAGRRHHSAQPGLGRELPPRPSLPGFSRSVHAHIA
mmetsp:Transcript_5760/g.14281  ORF Transcript_5760/g.14281 Transcript_5760/m.14281 type:complete len:239 (-) Transcript_5760:156-872(-)